MKRIIWTFGAVLTATSWNLAIAQPTDIRQGLVAYWPLETTDGVLTSDVTPFANHLSLVNMDAGNFVPGRYGNAALFNGTDELLTRIYTLGEDNGLPAYGARQYTVTLWVNGLGTGQGDPPGSAGDRRVFSEGSSTDTSPLFNIGTDSAAVETRANVVDLFIRGDTGTSTAVNHAKSAGAPFDGTWHHLAWVEEDGAGRLYIDGELDATVFNYTRVPTTLNTISVGGIQRGTPCCWFAGMIDDVAVWERPLSQAEIQEVMTNSLAVPVPDDLPPLFVLQPVGGPRAVGDRINLISRAVGNRPLTYQWYKDGEPLPGATSNSLALSDLTSDNSGDYTVVATTFSGAVTSIVATLTVAADPPPDVAQGLVSYWPMNALLEEPGALFPFSTPDAYSGNTMRLFSEGFFDQEPGMFSDAISFNAFYTDQYALRESGFPIYNNPAFSVAFWVKGNPTNQNDRRFFAESSTNNNNPLFTLGSDPGGTNGIVRVFIRDDLGTTSLARNSTRIALDETWHHVVWTDDNGQGKLYLDGVLDETDFTYTRGALTLDQTALAAVVRTNVVTLFTGALDEVAVWNRVLTFTEIQEIRLNGIPPPAGTIPPEVVLPPASQSVLTRSKVTFTFTATGTSPLLAQWRKNGANLVGETGYFLLLNNVTLDDAGDYDVVVSNLGGSVTSQVATLTVTLRPPAPAELLLDFDHTNAPPTDTQPGFLSWMLPAYGAGPFTRSFDGVDVTLSGVGVNMESRRRATPVNAPGFTEEQIFRDFVFARDSTPENGLDVAIQYLQPGGKYAVTVWSFDTGSTAARSSDWWANGVQVVTNYTFDGAASPTSDGQYRFSFETVADPDGTILVQGRRAAVGGTFNVFVNALRVALNEMRIVGIRLDEFGNIRLPIQATNPSATFRVEEKASLTDPDWTEVTGVSFGAPSGNVVEATFPPPPSTRFYRVVELP